MMKLLHAPLSPFVRKVLITAHLKGLEDKIELIDTDSSNPDGPLNDVNPLGKIPALILEDGRILFDSRVICEYLDAVGPAPSLFPAAEARWNVLTTGNLADGIADAMILTVYEKRFRPEEIWHPPWLDRQNNKIARAIAHLEANVSNLEGAGGTTNYGQISVACALGYLDLRGDGSWRKTAPKLVAWLDNFTASIPAFEITKPVA